MNAKRLQPFALVLVLTLQACTSAPRHEVTFKSDPAQFPLGDKIVIDQVFAPSQKLSAGDLVVVRGHYRLQSRSDAVLSLNAAPDVHRTQEVRNYNLSPHDDLYIPLDYPAALFAKRGEHRFELRYQMPRAGDLRIRLREIDANGGLTPFPARGPITLGVFNFTLAAL